jgi:hypothetical protein
VGNCEQAPPPSRDQVLLVPVYSLCGSHRVRNILQRGALSEHVGSFFLPLHRACF